MTIQQFNEADDAFAREMLHQCCASSHWIQKMQHGRPFTDREALQRFAREVWWTLRREDWLEAFAAHPKIGEKKLSEWCSQEQRNVLSETPDLLAALAEANQIYEQRFGWIFLVNASGKSGSQILEQFRLRLENSPEKELRKAAEEQAQITELRLKRALQA